MPEVLEKFAREFIAEIVQKMSPEDRLKGMSPEERLKGLSSEELKVIEQLLKEKAPPFDQR